MINEQKSRGLPVGSRTKRNQEDPTVPGHLWGCILEKIALRSELRQADSAYSTVRAFRAGPILRESNMARWEIPKLNGDQGRFTGKSMNTRGGQTFECHQFLGPLYMNFVWGEEIHDWGRGYSGRFWEHFDQWVLMIVQKVMHCDQKKVPKFQWA